MLFNFELRPLGEIVPWHDADGSNAHLSWFGLTDGWYWIEAGQVELFRYSRDLVARWQREHTGEPWLGALPYVDYQVVRLWEDVLEVLADALDPVPARLARALDLNEQWMTWERQAKEAVEATLSESEGLDLLEAAAAWWWNRQLYTGYLQAGPLIWFWCDTDNIHIQWDNRACVLDDMSAWEAVFGQHTMPTADFVSELRDFDARFMRRMHECVAIAQAEWPQPDVALDPHLSEEHVSRTQWLPQRFEALANHAPTAWDAIFRAITEIEALPLFASGQAAKLP